MNTTNKKIQLKVITPLRTVYEKAVDSVIVRSVCGDMGILYGHEPYSALLDYGMMRIFNSAGDKSPTELEDVLMVMGGIVTVSDNTVIVLSNMAEHPDKLQEVIDKLSAERSATRQTEQRANLDIHRAETVLRRSMVHMDVSTYSIIKGHDEQS